MLKSVLNGTQRSSLVGNLLQSSRDGVDGSRSLVAVVAVNHQSVDTKTLSAHHGDVHVDLVVCGGVSAYMQAQIHCAVQVSKGLNLQPSLLVARNSSAIILLVRYIGADGLDVLAIVVLYSSHHLIHAGKCLHVVAIGLAVLVQEVYYLTYGCLLVSLCIGGSRINRIVCGVANLDLISSDLGAVGDLLLDFSIIADVSHLQIRQISSTCLDGGSSSLQNTSGIIYTLGCSSEQTSVVSTKNPLSILKGQLSSLALVVALQQVGLVELGGIGYTVDLGNQLVNLALNCLSVALGHRAVSSLNCQLVHSLQHIVNFRQSTFSGLHCADTVLSVGRSLSQTSDLLSHLLGNSQTCRIISCAVDLVAG